MQRPIIGAIYKNYKSKGGLDNLYRVTGFAKDLEASEVLVVYEALYCNDWLVDSEV